MDLKFLPPLFLKTPKDVKSFLRKYPDFTTKSEARKWLSFAKQKKLVKPPLLSVLPENFTLEVLTIREDYVRSFFLESNMAEFGQFLTKINDEVLEELIDVSLRLPEDYLDMANDAVRQGKDILNSISGKTRYRPPDIPSSRLSPGIFELPEIMSTLFFYYLNKRDQKIKAFIKETFLKMILYDDALYLNKKLISNLKHSRDKGEYFRLAEKLYELFCVKLTRKRNQIFMPLLRRFMGQIEEKINKIYLNGIDDPAMIKSLSRLKSNISGVFSLLEGSGEELIYRAKEVSNKLDQLFVHFESKIEYRVITRIKSICLGFLEKVCVYENFFEKEFKINSIQELYNTIKRLGMIRIVKNAVPTGVSLTLYPTKDYFDYFKSIGSDDCTLRNDLSAKHLQHPRFFNIRIYANWTKHSSEINRWIGNIYCLDYTKKGNKHVENIIVLDRIQINRSAKFFPISFFKSFMESLSQLLQANEKYTVIGPTRISNYKFINSSYKSYIAGRKLKKFNFETDDKVFECSRYKRFYELN